MFYFLNRNFVEGKRYVVGCAMFEKFEILSSKEAWKIYGNSLGCVDENDFICDINDIYKCKDMNIGCIVLSELEFYKNPVTLEECDVQFSPYTVSGKKITEEECQRIDSEARKGEK